MRVHFFNSAVIANSKMDHFYFADIFYVGSENKINIFSLLPFP